MQHFNHRFGAQSYACTFKVQFDRLIVATAFGTETVPLNPSDDPLRVARVVAHDMLSKASRDKLI